jgi:hypothetical protein
LSNTEAGMKVTLIGRGGSTPGGRVSGGGRVLHQVFGLIGPHDLSRDANVIAQNAGPFGDRKSGLRVDPPRQELGDPTVGVRVAGRANVRPDTAG